MHGEKEVRRKKVNKLIVGRSTRFRIVIGVGIQISKLLRLVLIRVKI